VPIRPAEEQHGEHETERKFRARHAHGDRAVENLAVDLRVFGRDAAQAAAR
jgi:hypothetical protein